MDPFSLDEVQVLPESFRIIVEGKERKVEPKVMSLLVYLAERPNRVVSKAELLEHVWRGTTVVEEALLRAVSVLRSMLDDNPSQARFIETIPKKGYRLLVTPLPLSGTSQQSGKILRLDISPRILVLMLVILGLAGYLVWEKFINERIETPAPSPQIGGPN